MKETICIECGKTEPKENFVKVKAITKTGLEYYVLLCFECATGESKENE